MAHKWFKCNKRAYNVKNNNETLETGNSHFYSNFYQHIL